MTHLAFPVMPTPTNSLFGMTLLAFPVMPTPTNFLSGMTLLPKIRLRTRISRITAPPLPREKPSPALRAGLGPKLPRLP